MKATLITLLMLPGLVSLATGAEAKPLKHSEMHIEQIYTGCLAHAAYYIRSGNEVAIVDPLREIEPYIERAKRDGATIKYILETHFHADFVSGHLSLAAATGAEIIYGPNAQPAFTARVVEDGEVLPLGEISIVALHTPGHTMESTTYLLRDSEGKDHSIFTGDTLFLGDVGRPDLAQKGKELTTEMLAGHLYDALRNKIMTLDDEVIVYPGHGAGSACGKKMSSATVGTVGGQKASNYALRADMSREEFIREVTDGLERPPAYFPLNAKMNKEGYTHIDEVLASGLQALSPRAFEAVANESEAIVLDVRSKEEYATAHIPNSIFIGLDGNFAPWVGDMIMDVKQKLLLVTPEGREEEAVTRLSRIGFDHVLGYLEGGVESWSAAGFATDNTEQISAQVFATNRLQTAMVVDVRNAQEFAAGAIEGAINTPLRNLNDYLSMMPKEDTFYLHCQSGFRSQIAASILKARGIHNFVEIAGGVNALREAGVDLVSPVTENME
jgi:glyoxylase-like metal-dependent hydrolase (beta-lactamase superfamily II)/rhodanese-related sulfurtransferase